MRLLLVEDDVMVASGIKLGLTDAGYAVDWVGSGERAEEVLRTEAFDAAIIDIGLPHMDGLELTRRLRRPDMASHAMPVLILTARDALHDRVQGLDLGADDYMIKPFELPELLARLRALLRRSQAATTAVLSFGPIELDTANRRASAHRGGQSTAIELGPREWTVLEYLLINAPKPASKDKLLQALTGWDKEITPNAVEVYISRLRGKLEPHGVALRSIRGFGYRLELSEPNVPRETRLPGGARRPARGSDLLGMTSGLRRRLLVMLIAPLILLALLNAWFDYRSADNVAPAAGPAPAGAGAAAGGLGDRRGRRAGDPPVLLLAPAVEEFLQGPATMPPMPSSDADGKVLLGEPGWAGCRPPRRSPSSTARRTWARPGASCASASRRCWANVVVALADGSDPRQQWARSILLQGAAAQPGAGRRRGLRRALGGGARAASRCWT